MLKTLALVLLALPIFAHAKAVDCENAMTTIEMNVCVGQKMEVADTQLEQYIAKAKEHHAQQTTAIASLAKSQDAWLMYRQSHCDAIYEMWSNGSIRGVMFGECMIHLTKQRTHQIWEDYLTYMDATPPVLPEPK